MILTNSCVLLCNLLVSVQAHEQSIINVIWLPPEYGDAIACVCADGTLSLWEEVAEGQLLVSFSGLIYDVLCLQLSCTLM